MLPVQHVLQQRYVIQALLGQGGMGAVYVAKDTRLNVRVAVKELIPQPGLDGSALLRLRQQFQREAEVVARLQHPHLVGVTDFFIEKGNAYLVMNYVEGESLAQLITRQGALPEVEVLRWADQLLDALAYCHEQGIIHRDVKPANVIIRSDGNAVLVDFGLVKLWDPTDPRTRTIIMGMGTPEYAPPEQYGMRPEHTGPQTDLYSLAATLYHALTGRNAPTATDRMANPNSFLRPRALNQQLSARTETALLRGLELPMERRFTSAREMAAALRPAAPPPLPPPPGRQIPYRALGGVALILLLLVAAYFLFGRGDGGNKPSPPSVAGGASPTQRAAVTTATAVAATPFSGAVAATATTPATATRAAPPAPSRTPAPTASVTPSATPSREPVVVHPYCEMFGESPVYVEADQPVLLRWTWTATQPDLVQDHIDAARYDIYLDGERVTAERRGDIEYLPDEGWYAVSWVAPVRFLEPGEHLAERYLSWSRQISDGWNTFGPGGEIETEYDRCLIVVSS